MHNSTTVAAELAVVYRRSMAVAEGIGTRRPNVWQKVKSVAEGYKFEKSAILFEKN